MKNTKQGRIVHTRGQVFAGWIAFILLFVCGIMVGVGLNKKQTEVASNTTVIQMSEDHCDNIAYQMTTKSTSAEKLVELQKIYSENCAGRKKKEEKAKSENKENVEPKETCEIIEDLLLKRIYPEDTSDIDKHEANIAVYEKLIMNGCSENQMKYHKQSERERKIVAALQQSGTQGQTCEQIEDIISEGINYESHNYETRIRNAGIYAQLSERGCAENSQKYAELAKQELEIARAIEDDRLSGEAAIDVANIYKRLNMQAAAQEFLDTLKGFVDPTVNFILEIERIVNK